ncbi:hypothetical protein QDR37_01640 [Amnibacterium sp. CER49]|uniref:hypothetical protein n=1 Tax=Amnibacterium sp. CER49 TaxID=3039161 RepID=UPI00244A4C58|nr:hypothetical protein [Amnibacterium sp. CER49]MDH2442638.1 hypothetical protein [Amnibacterium sp. CER49]
MVRRSNGGQMLQMVLGVAFIVIGLIETPTVHELGWWFAALGVLQIGLAAYGVRRNRRLDDAEDAAAPVRRPAARDDGDAAPDDPVRPG